MIILEVLWRRAINHKRLLILTEANNSLAIPRDFSFVHWPHTAHDLNAIICLVSHGEVVRETLTSPCVWCELCRSCKIYCAPGCAAVSCRVSPGAEAPPFSQTPPRVGKWNLTLHFSNIFRYNCAELRFVALGYRHAAGLPKCERAAGKLRQAADLTAWDAGRSTMHWMQLWYSSLCAGNGRFVENCYSGSKDGRSRCKSKYTCRDFNAGHVC